MRKRLALVLLIGIGGPIILYWIGVFTDTYIFTSKEDQITYDGSFTSYLAVYGHAIIGVILLAITAGLIALIRYLLIHLRSYILTGDWDW